jgi:hypothetical protein
MKSTKSNASDERAEVVSPDTAVLAGAPDLPPALAQALSEAGDTLARYDRLKEVLQRTHNTIPEFLRAERDLTAELGKLEIGGGAVGSLRSRLAEVVSQREAAARQRAAACQAVLQMEGELSTARGQMTKAEGALVTRTVSRFLARWKKVADEVVALEGEARALAAALHCRIDTAGELQRLLSAAPTSSVSLPPVVAEVSGTLARLDTGLALAGAIKQSHTFDERHYQLSLRRNTPAQLDGVYRVRKPFHSGLDGEEFAVGTLVDRDLVGTGNLARLASANFVYPADLDTAGHRAA